MQTQEKTLDTKSSSAGQIDLGLAKIYHEAPDDVFEVIVSKLLYVRVMWSLNIFRLVNKRCKRFAESCTTRLTNVDKEDGPGYLPITIIQRCRNIESIDCQSCNLSSLEGCPRGLKRLEICALYVYDFSPLAFCPLMESITIMEPCGTDISFVASMPLLTEFSCLRDREGT